MKRAPLDPQQEFVGLVPLQLLTPVCKILDCSSGTLGLENDAGTHSCSGCSAPNEVMLLDTVDSTTTFQGAL